MALAPQPVPAGITALLQPHPPRKQPCPTRSGAYVNTTGQQTRKRIQEKRRPFRPHGCAVQCAGINRAHACSEQEHAQGGA